GRRRRGLRPLPLVPHVHRLPHRGADRSLPAHPPRRRRAEMSSIRIAVDIGGTFTDGLAVLTPGGRIWVAKTLTTPRDPGEAVTTVITDLLRQVSNVLANGHSNVTEVVHGTTLVTNTLIERK